MSTKHVRTAADLVRFHRGLRVDCLGCGHSAEAEAWDVARLFQTQPLDRIAAQLKCSVCGAKDVRLAVIDPPPPR